MKKLISILFSVALAFNSTNMMASTSVSNTTTEASSSTDKVITNNETTRLVNRVKEIMAMDRKNLTPAERKSLKKELIAMKQNAKEPGVGIYISGTALLIIIILLIIFL